VYNRTASRAEALCASAAEWGASACESVDEKRLPEVVSAANVVIHATPIGAGGAVKKFHFLSIHSTAAKFGWIWRTAQTHDLGQNGSGEGAVAIDGREMLVMQAAGAYRLWTGFQPPIAVMRKSIDHGER